MNEIIFSCVIPASKKDSESQNLKDLISSIKSQDFPQNQIEILVVTEGDSEQAKAIGIRKSKGKICAMFCADNYLMENDLFKRVKNVFYSDSCIEAIYEKHYAYLRSDNSLNRYFSLIGNNDPIPFYLGKCDREPWVDGIYKRQGMPSYGCNGFFVKKECFKKTDLAHYYPMDAHVDMKLNYIIFDRGTVWHRTSDNLFTFLKKRYRYARDLYCDRRDRRWKVIDTGEDRFRLFLFIFATITIIQPLSVSLRGFFKIRDWAWFWHWPVAFGFLVTYSALVIRNLFKHGTIFQVKCAPAR